MSFIEIKEETLFKTLVKELLKEYYHEALVKENEDIIAVGISLDCDITSFYFCYHTNSGVKENIEKQKRYIKEIPELKNMKLDGDIWALSEWISEYKETIIDYPKDLKHNQACEIIDTNYEKNNEENFVRYKNKMFDIFCEAFLELKKENTFKLKGEKFLMIVQECDNGLYETRKESLSKILTSKQLKEYIKFLDDLN